MKTPILGSAYVARSVNAADNRMVNLFPEIVPEGGKEPAFLQRAPGLKFVASMGTGPIRGLWAFGGYMYVASGSALYRVDTNYAITWLGNINGSGPVSMADNGIQLFVACNPDSFIYNASTEQFAQISDPDFPGAVTVGYLDGYFIFNQPDSQEFWVTELDDGSSIYPLDFASAEGSPDNIVSINVNHREVWLFGNNSIEVWYNAGLADFPLARIEGAFMEIGCLAPYSVAKLNNNLFWLGSDARGNGIVYQSNGYNAQRVSTHAVEWQIQGYNVLTDAIGYTYQQDGHMFYVLVFPTADTTWVFDVSTGAWHERASWVNGKYLRHRSNCQVNFNNQIIVGDYLTGVLYAFDMENFSDCNRPQRWLRSWRALPTGQNNLRRTAHHNLQLDCETGVDTNQFAYELNGAAVSAGILQATTNTEPGLTIFNEVFDGRKLGDVTGTGTLSSADAAAVLAYTNGTLNDQAQAAYIGGRLLYEMVRNPAKYVDYLNYLYQNTGVDPGLLLTESGDFLVTESGDFLETSFSALRLTNAAVMLRWSDDGGHTWSNEHWALTGAPGEYGRRTMWRRLGMTLKLRDRVYEVSGVDPVKTAIMGAELIVSPTRA